MAKVIAAALLLLFPTLLRAATIRVGDADIVIPAPAGFSKVTSEMTNLDAFLRSSIPASNEEFIRFIPDQYILPAKGGEIPNIRRRFSVQTIKEIVWASASQQQFLDMKAMIQSSNMAILRDMNERYPGLVGENGINASTKSDVSEVLNTFRLIPLPIHEESDDVLAYSALLNIAAISEAGVPANFVTVVTTSLVFIKGKVLFLFAYAEPEGLQWSRTISHKWAAAVTRANHTLSAPANRTPTDRAPEQRETKPQQSWQKYAGLLIGGISVLLFLLAVGWLVREDTATDLPPSDDPR